MTHEQKAKRISVIKEGYALFNLYTKMPYIECEEENFFDQVFLFDSKEEAQEYVDQKKEQGILLAVTSLLEKDVPIADLNGKLKTIKVSQVRQFVVMVRQLCVNAVCYKPAKEEAEVVELAEILPEDLKEPLTPETLAMTRLQLTGIYLAQEVRKEEAFRDMEKVAVLRDEYFSNLVNAKLLMPVIPPEGKEKDEEINLGECMLPHVNNGEDKYLALFSDPTSVQVFCKGKNARTMFVPFTGVLNMCPEEVKGCVINPQGFSLPVLKEEVPGLIEKYLKQE